MSNTLTGYSSTKTGEKILRTLEVRFDKQGQLTICSHEGFALNEMDDLRWCRVFSRERYRIKVALYDRDLRNPDDFARTLCESWFGDYGSGNWRTVELSDCDR